MYYEKCRHSALVSNLFKFFNITGYYQLDFLFSKQSVYGPPPPSLSLSLKIGCLMKVENLHC